MKRLLAGVAATAMLAGGVPAAAAAVSALGPSVPSVPVLTGPRASAPVVLTGKQLPALSAPAPVPLRALYTDTEDRATFVPPDSSDGANVPVDSLAVFAYRDGSFVEVPSQVDERFWRFLSNPGGESGELSGFDVELGHVFDTEGFRRTAGDCYATFPAGAPVTTPDTVPGLDDDDELVFMARDAGVQAPADAAPVPGRASYEVTVTDPATFQQLFAYVVAAPGRAHTFTTSYVSYERDTYGDRFVPMRGGQGIPEGVRCEGVDPVDLATTASTSFGPRRPRDFSTFRSDRYAFHFGGRWKPDGLQVAGTDGQYDVDLIDQWKGRAFQQARKQAVSIGFIGEKAWEESSVLLGERVGPVRALRETWGAKSGTNITRLFTMYDEYLTDTINLRVHPIPPDGVYSMWDHNAGAVSTYYSPMVPDGVPIDGKNDELLGNLDVGVGTPAESHYDVADPTTQPYAATEQWEQVAGPHGSVVYYTHVPRPTAAVITSYYRDDAEFDDGSGEDPVVKQGSFGAHGMHIYATADTDNTPLGVPFDELQVVTAQYPLVGDAGNVGEEHAAVERLPLQVETSLREATGGPGGTPSPEPTGTASPEPTASAEPTSRPGRGGKPTDKPGGGRPDHSSPTPTPTPTDAALVEAAQTLPGSTGVGTPSLVDDGRGVSWVGASGPSLWRGAPDFAPVAPAGPLAALPRTGPADVAADAAGYLHAASASGAGIAVSRSIDDGETWDRATPLAGVAPTGVPRIAAGRFNSGLEGATLTLAYPSAGGISVARSLDGGLSFPQHGLAAAGCMACAATLGPVVVDPVDDASVWLTHGGPSGVFVLRSSDSGVTFTAVPVAAGAVEAAPALARAADGTLAVAWTGPDGTGTARSTDGGATWSAPVSTAPAGRAVAAAFSGTGALAVVTSSVAGDGTQPLVSLSRDGGMTFLAPAALDVAGQVRAPRLAVAGDSTGRFRAVWQQVDAAGSTLRTARAG